MNDRESTARIVFMGTPDFAVPTLRALCEEGRPYWTVVAAVTQPDRPAGRGNKVIAPPVKIYAEQHNVPVLQPGRLRRDQESLEALQALAPDVIVVAAYGQILPAQVLAIPEFGCINVHASLLPAYRGASPISQAILDGLDETGVTMMLMDEGMDTGPMLAQATHPIGDDDTTETLSARLAQQGADLLVETLDAWLSGNVAPVDQSELPGEPSTCSLVKKQHGQIDWSQSAVQIERMTRAYAPWPSAFTQWQGQNFKIWRAEPLPGSADPGLVVETIRGPAVGTGQGLLLLHEVQPAGKRAMDVGSFVNGSPDFVGSVLGENRG